MKKLIIMMAFAAIVCGCDNNDPQGSFGPDGPFGPGGPDGPGRQGGMGQAGSFDETALGEVATFTVEPYTSAHAESETIPSGDEDYIENKSFKGEIRVEYRADSEASVTGAPEGAITIEGNRVTENDEKQKGTYYSKGQTIISGKGALSINANYKHGIDTKDYLRIRPGAFIAINAIAGNCIKCEDSTEDGTGLTIEGGTLNLKTTATAGKCISADGNVTINGGYICAITTGGGEWDGDDADPKDVSGAAGVKCDGIFTMNDGELMLSSSGKGGKGINGDTKIVINGGKVRALTTGDMYSYTYGGFTYDTSPKGIKCDKEIEVSGGDVLVRALGAQEGSEGIEAKEKFCISGGKVQIYAADDALNTGYSSESIAEKQKMGIDVTDMKANAGQIIISGGELYAYSTSNDAIDSNGTISVTGGLAVAVGAGTPEGGFDCDNNTFAIKGGSYTFGSSIVSCASDRWVNGSAVGGQGGPGGNPGPSGGPGPGRP